MLMYTSPQHANYNHTVGLRRMALITLSSVLTSALLNFDTNLRPMFIPSNALISPLRQYARCLETRYSFIIRQAAMLVYHMFCYRLIDNLFCWRINLALSSSCARVLVQWLKLPAWKVGDRGFEPLSSLQVSEKENVSLCDREVAWSASDRQG